MSEVVNIRPDVVRALRERLVVLDGKSGNVNPVENHRARRRKSAFVSSRSRRDVIIVQARPGG
jgi:hypothetical protein